MKLIDTQDVFETLWQASPDSKAPDGPIPQRSCGMGLPLSERSSEMGLRKSDRMFLVYFTAKWCGPCKRIDLTAVDKAAQAKGLTLWKVEHTENEYTTGFCNVRAFPTFMAFKPKKVVATFQSNVTEEICTWIESLD
jgi:thiol-disulfide isomerase/thioredoxin